MPELKRLIAAASPGPSVWVRFTRATTAQDIESNRWDVDPGCEMEVTPQMARQLVNCNAAIVLERRT